MDTQQMLGVLLNTTEQQSQTTEKLLAGLKDQIDALNAATQAAQKAALTVGQSAVMVEQAAKNASPAIQKAAGDAVGVAVRDSLAGASQTASTALETAVKPILGKLSGVVQAASEAEGSMRSAGAWFAWKWVAVAAGGLVGVCLVAYAALAWEMRSVSSLRDEQVALTADIAQMQANADALAKKGRRITLSSCTDSAGVERLCIPVSTNQGTGYENYTAPFSNAKTGVQFVIPRGY